LMYSGYDSFRRVNPSFGSKKVSKSITELLQNHIFGSK
jgi:hypothetical protein